MNPLCGALSAQAHAAQRREVSIGSGRSQKQRLMRREA